MSKRSDGERFLKGIISYTSKGRVGWHVNVRWAGQQRMRFFAWAQHGGKRAALAKATAWRNATEAALGKPRTERMVVQRGTGRNVGVQGVWVGWRHSRGRKTPAVWVAWAPHPRKVAKKAFSITKHGLERATALAVQLRQQKMAEIIAQQDIPPRARRKKTKVTIEKEWRLIQRIMREVEGR